MVKTCVYYFDPQGNRRYNNSSLVLDLYDYFDECEDLHIVELSHLWEFAEPKVEENYLDFDVILAVGESDNLSDIGEIEAVAKVNGVTVQNKSSFPNLEHIKVNKTYDESNNFTCNKLNYFMLSKKKKINFAFVHVPVKKKNNSKILNDLSLLLSNMRSRKGQHVHHIEAVVERKFTRGYTGKKNTDCTVGIYFPFNKRKNHEMTMEKTPQDLDIIFMEKNGKVISIKNAKKKTGMYSDTAYSVLEIPTPYCLVNYIKKKHIIKIVEYI
jgi:uncharacterized membrane protein (UPF0127 family)